MIVAILGIGSVISIGSSGDHTSRSATSVPRHPGGVRATSTQPSYAADQLAAPANGLAPRQFSAEGATRPGGCHLGEACPADAVQPSFVGGSFTDPIPRGGNGNGRAGECTGNETTVPCASGVVVALFYSMTIPSGCGEPVVFDGRRWWSADAAVPGVKGVPANAWLRLDRDGKVLVVAPFGTVMLVPATGWQPVVCLHLAP